MTYLADHCMAVTYIEQSRLAKVDFAKIVMSIIKASATMVSKFQGQLTPVNGFRNVLKISIKVIALVGAVSENLPKKVGKWDSVCTHIISDTATYRAAIYQGYILL